MAKVLLVFLSMSVFSICYGQDTRFCGNWITCGYWGMNYYQIKKSKKVKWYSSGCTDRGTIHRGTWTSEGDTITIISDKRTIQFVLKEGKLCMYDKDGNHGDAKYGISKSNHFMTMGAVNSCRKEWRKEKRKRKRRISNRK